MKYNGVCNSVVCSPLMSRVDFRIWLYHFVLLCSRSVMSDSLRLWTVAHQAPLSMGFPRQEYWSGLPFPSPGDLPNPGIKLASPALPGKFFTAGPPGKRRLHS